jgi:hypothetical protein
MSLRVGGQHLKHNELGGDIRDQSDVHCPGITDGRTWIAVKPHIPVVLEKNFDLRRQPCGKALRVNQEIPDFHSRGIEICRIADHATSTHDGIHAWADIRAKATAWGHDTE